MHTLILNMSTKEYLMVLLHYYIDIMCYLININTATT